MILNNNLFDEYNFFTEKIAFGNLIGKVFYKNNFELNQQGFYKKSDYSNSLVFSPNEPIKVQFSDKIYPVHKKNIISKSFYSSYEDNTQIIELSLSKNLEDIFRFYDKEQEKYLFKLMEKCLELNKKTNYLYESENNSEEISNLLIRIKEKEFFEKSCKLLMHPKNIFIKNLEYHESIYNKNIKDELILNLSIPYNKIYIVAQDFGFVSEDGTPKISMLQDEEIKKNNNFFNKKFEMILSYKNCYIVNDITLISAIEVL